MTTASEEILARYSRVEKEVDAFGRIIAVKRLKPSQITAVREMTPNLIGSTEVENEKGEKVSISDRAELMVVASVVSIDGDPVPFPRNRAELDRVYNGLDREGVTAATAAFLKLHAPTDGEAKDPVVQAKN